MPGKVKVKILAGRNLPVMDRSSDTTDAYVEVKLGNTTYKTDVCRKSLNPTWDSEWYRYEVDDSELQDEPLQIRLMDHDTYSANDSIGKVYLDLNPLLLPPCSVGGKVACSGEGPPNSGSAPGGSVFSGWIPVFDTMHGIRGEVNIIVKVELFSDFNKFRQSSCGVQFFCSPQVPIGYQAQVVHGFVEELVVNDDPEYQWIDKIRTPRASNEARQTLFFKLSGEVQRKIGLKALDLGGNAVVGYHQCFDLEGESGIVVRGIGTAVTLNKMQELLLPSYPLNMADAEDSGSPAPGVSAGPLDPSAPPARAPSPTPAAAAGAAPPRMGASLRRIVSRMKAAGRRSGPGGGERLARVLGRTLGALRARLGPGDSTAPAQLRARSASDCRRTPTAAAAATAASERRPFSHARSASESLARVPEARESPAASPPRPAFLRLPAPAGPPPALRYVDGHLVSNTSSGVSSSSSDSSPSDADADRTWEETAPEPAPAPARPSRRRPSFRLLADLAAASLRRLPARPADAAAYADDVFEDAPTGPGAGSRPPPPRVAVIANTPPSCTPSPTQAPGPCPPAMHKSQSAASLQPRPPAPPLPAPHASAALKHGPCLPPPSRLAHDEAGAERPPASPPVASTAAAAVASAACAAAARVSPSPARLCSLPAICRRSSDSDLSITPKGNSLTGSDRSSTTGGAALLRMAVPPLRPPLNQDSLEMMEYPFLTMTQYPPGFVLHLGGAVSARSVKLLERVSNLDEPETRDAWWTELRMEVRSHARALACNVVLGYTETTSICEDVCVLSASGTAAVVSLGSDPEAAVVVALGLAGGPPRPAVQPPPPPPLPPPLPSSDAHLPPVLPPPQLSTSLDRPEFDCTIPLPMLASGRVRVGVEGSLGSAAAAVEAAAACGPCHLPYSDGSVPLRGVTVLRCALCRRGRVPEVLLATLEPPEGLAVLGRGGLLAAYVCRPKRDCRGELNAKEISDGLPFLEYELHRTLSYKLKLQGMNAVFGLRVQVTVGERLMVAVATGTAVFLAALPAPAVPKVSAGNAWTDDRQLVDTQRRIQDTVRRSREAHLLRPMDGPVLAPVPPSSMPAQAPPAPTGSGASASDTDDSEEELPDLDLSAGNKDACVLEVDDAEDMDVISLLLDPQPPNGFVACTTEQVPGLDEADVAAGLHMFTHVWRSRLPSAQVPRALHSHFQRLLQAVFFKLRRTAPCALCRLRFRVELPEPDEVQISVLGMALALVEPGERPLPHPHRSFRRRLPPPTLPHSTSREGLSRRDESDLIFSLEEDQVAESAAAAAPPLAPAPAPTSANSTRNTTPAPAPAVAAMPASATNSTSCLLPPARPQGSGCSEACLQAVRPPRFGIDITPLANLPGGRIERYLGNLNFFFIRESTSIREAGGLSGFVHSFVTEVLAIVRAHVTALGGNAMVAYFMSECVLYHNPHKNQGQCLINVGGDVVAAVYDD